MFKSQQFTETIYEEEAPGQTGEVSILTTQQTPLRIKGKKMVNWSPRSPLACPLFLSLKDNLSFLALLFC